MKERVYNFSAGPSMLADQVLEEIHEELYSYNSTGMSVMEMSHRGKEYLAIFNDCKERLRRIMEISEDYEILFMHGGATGQFSAVPLNLMKTGKADYIITGNFSKKAAEEAAKFGQVNIIYDSSANDHTRIPELSELSFSPDADYVHLCSNNTIFGTQWQRFPDTGNVPLVADMSSDILSRRINVADFGLIYAGAQKNMGVAGMAVVIVRKDLIRSDLPDMPVLCNYAIEAKNDSMYNTPPTHTIYVLDKVLKWIEESGGLEEMEKRNRQKAKLLYDYLDSQTFYQPHSEKGSRSIMNVTFTTPDKETDSEFAALASQKGLVSLKGHRLVGGIRASIYNAMPIEGVRKLIDFMEEFAGERK